MFCMVFSVLLLVLGSKLNRLGVIFSSGCLIVCLVLMFNVVVSCWLMVFMWFCVFSVIILLCRCCRRLFSCWWCKVLWCVVCMIFSVVLKVVCMELCEYRNMVFMFVCVVRFVIKLGLIIMFMLWLCRFSMQFFVFWCEVYEVNIMFMLQVVIKWCIFLGVLLWVMSVIDFVFCCVCVSVCIMLKFVGLMMIMGSDRCGFKQVLLELFVIIMLGCFVLVVLILCMMFLKLCVMMCSLVWLLYLVVMLRKRLFSWLILQVQMWGWLVRLVLVGLMV